MKLVVKDSADTKVVIIVNTNRHESSGLIFGSKQLNSHLTLVCLTAQ